jgi:predicted nucleic acid-binding protein
VIHLDTSFLVDLLREHDRGEEGPARRWLAARPDEPLGVSVHVACELFAGAELGRDAERERLQVGRLLDALEPSYPDAGFAPLYGRLYADLERAGQRVPALDLLIATAAVGAGAALLTRNTSDFARVPGLRVVGY